MSRDILLLVFSWISFPPAPEYSIRTPTMVSMTPGHRRKNCRRCQRHRRQIYHWYQQQWRQIFPPVPLVLLIPVANLPPVSLTPVVHLELRISPQIFEKIWNSPNGIIWGLGENDKKSRGTVPLNIPMQLQYQTSVPLTHDEQNILILLVCLFELQYRKTWTELMSLRGLMCTVEHGL